MDSPSLPVAERGDIAFVRLGSFSYVNDSLRVEMSRQFHGYRIDNVDSCKWAPQPSIRTIVNAASFEYPKYGK